MDESEITIENHLRELRRRHDLSQEELAEALGISRQSVIAFEQGKFLPSLPIVVSLCKFFNTAFEDLFAVEREIFDEEPKNQIEVKVISSADVAPRKEKNMNTELEPWRPFREAISLRDAVDRLLSDSFITPRTGASGAGMPKVDIKERKEDILIKVELPGLSEEEIDVEVSSDGIVTISGEKAEEKEEVGEKDNYYYKESYSGSFSRSFSLPTEVVAGKAEANMEHGVLTVTVPKARPEKVQKLKISPKKK